MDKSLLGLRLQPSGVKTRNRFPCLLPEEGRESWSLIWGDGSGQRGGLGGLPTPLVVLCAGSCTGSCFCSDTSIVAIGFVIFCVLLFIICPNCTVVYLFLVPSNFFVFCCLERCLSRCRRCSKRSQVPGPSPSQTEGTHGLQEELGGREDDRCRLTNRGRMAAYRLHCLLIVMPE